MINPSSRVTVVSLLSFVFAIGCGGGSASEGTGGNGSGSNGSGLDVAGEGSGASSGNGAGGSGLGGFGSSGGAVSGGGTTASAGSAGTTTDVFGACSNGLDDDDDGLVDGLDPECTGPLDDDEGTFATGIPGDNRDPKWQDCFFDGNSGAGDDNCRYATGCLYGELESDDPSCTLTEECVEKCKPLTPNGCDCFGCCTIQGADGENVDVLIGPGCSVDVVGDDAACPRCVKSSACENTCGRCELCPGKTEADLPADCGTGGGGSGGSPGTGGSSGGGNPPPSYTCDGGEQVCSDSLACPSDYYCQLGCCRVVVR